MFSKINVTEQEEYMTISNADSFFENFDKKIQVKLSPPKTQERRYDNIPRICYEDKYQQNQICKSLERVFQQCNNNPTIKKPQLPEPPDFWDDYSTRTKQSICEDKGSTIRLGKFIETNKNLSFNQLKIIFNQQNKSNASKIGKSLRFPPECCDLNKTNDQMEKVTQQSMTDISHQKYNEPPEQQFKIIKKPSPLRMQAQKIVPLVDIFLENQKSNLQHYVFPKSNINKQGSGYLSFHASNKNLFKNYADADEILKRNGSQHRNTSQSNHSRPKNQSTHTQLQQMNNNYSLSMAQLLKPRHKNNNSKNINENSTTSLMSNTTQYAINKAMLSKQLNKMKPQQSRNLSPQTNITPFVSSRLQKQKTQNSYIQNKSFENNIDQQPNLALYFCQDMNKLKRVGTNSRTKFTLHNESCRDENINPNPIIYLNFADFKKALKTNKQQRK